MSIKTEMFGDPAQKISNTLKNIHSSNKQILKFFIKSRVKPVLKKTHKGDPRISLNTEIFWVGPLN